jgi:hypothetical protein
MLFLSDRRGVAVGIEEYQSRARGPLIDRSDIACHAVVLLLLAFRF